MPDGSHQVFEVVCSARVMPADEALLPLPFARCLEVLEPPIICV